MSGEMIGNYRLVRELGSGAMGTVYEAVDVLLERPVAIKMLRPEIANNPDLIERFRAEAVTLAKLNHPSIATLFAFLREGERFAMVMEFVRGRSLEGLLSSAGRLHPALAADIMRQILDGVAHAHGMNVLHRDIKPANIMIAGERVVKVTDFGIARILGAARMTRQGNIIGTLEYIAPERIRGEEEDPRSDLYSAGVVLFELLAGRLPFVSDTDYGLIQAHLQQPPPELSALGVECPAPLQSVLRKALAKAPSDRYQSAWEFREALAAAVGAPPAMRPTRLAPPALKPTRLAEGPPPTRLAEAPTPRPPMLHWAVVVAALALLAAGAGALAWLRFRGVPAIPPAVVATAPEPARVAPPAPPPPAAVPEPPVFTPPAPPNQVSVPVPAPAALSAAPEVRREPEPAPPPMQPGPANIRAVRRLYVEKMANDLDVHIKDEIRKQLPALRLAARRADADAIMKGTVEKRGDTGSTLTRGYLGVKSEYSAAVRVTGVEGGKLLWAGEAGDARALVGAIRRGGPKRVAERIVTDLRKAIEK